MMRKLSRIACMALALALIAPRCAYAFSPWGPLEAWQTADLDYSNPLGTVRYYYWWEYRGFQVSENGAPKNFDEGSRLTTPIITYGFDNTFLDYFGTEGVAAVDSAMKVLNALPSASSANLDNFLTDGAQQVNYTAQASELMDLKSTVLWMMIEHMGLLGDTHVFDLRGRAKYVTSASAGQACDYWYWVINHNVDPVSYNFTPYVNGRLYIYSIWDGCGAGIDVGATVVAPADSAQPNYTSVATAQNLADGAYYLNLTRDDMGGLQYLYRANNYAYQTMDPGTIVTPASSGSWLPVNTTNAATGVAGTANFTGLIGGVEKITFVKVKYDSLLGNTFTPINLTYSVPWVTNFTVQKLQVTRTITAPDIIFAANDMFVAGDPFAYNAFTRSTTFIPSPYASPGGGVTPSTIAAAMLIVLNNVGPIYWNQATNDMDISTLFEPFPFFNWASFDGSTNPPIVYPNGSSLAGLEEQATQGGQTLPPTTWMPVLNTGTNTTTTGGGGGVTGGGGG